MPHPLSRPSFSCDVIAAVLQHVVKTPALWWVVWRRHCMTWWMKYFSRILSRPHGYIMHKLKSFETSSICKDRSIYILEIDRKTTLYLFPANGLQWTNYLHKNKFRITQGKWLKKKNENNASYIIKKYIIHINVIRVVLEFGHIQNTLTKLAKSSSSQNFIWISRFEPYFGHFTYSFSHEKENLPENSTIYIKWLQNAI